jgi:hypothetical protein
MNVFTNGVRTAVARGSGTSCRDRNSCFTICLSKNSNYVHKSPPLVRVWARRIQSTPSHSNIIFPSTPESSEQSLPFTFSNQNFVFISQLPHACYVPTNSMEQSPSWEADSRSPSQKFSNFYGTRRFITVFTTARHRSLPCATSSYFFSIHCDVILPYLRKFITNVWYSFPVPVYLLDVFPF